MKLTMPVVLLMLWGLPLRARSEDPSSALTIYTRFAQLPSNISIATMKTELDAIMTPFHRSLQWRSMADANGRDVFPEVVVVTFNGVCRADPPPRSGASGNLGWTHIAGGKVQPFAEVDCDRIRELLGEPFGFSPPVACEMLLGRAMARVLAHELYHFLAHTTKHAAKGIAKATYTSAELSGNSMRFDEAQLRLVRADRRN